MSSHHNEIDATLFVTLYFYNLTSQRDYVIWQFEVIVRVTFCVLFLPEDNRDVLTIHIFA